MFMKVHEYGLDLFGKLNPDGLIKKGFYVKNLYNWITILCDHPFPTIIALC
jgi:hypothetical protein